jgi:tetratricopeptide (TPR) repeat protein
MQPSVVRGDAPLAGLHFTLTGRFASMTQEAAAALIAEQGGSTSALPTQATDYVVIGQESWPLDELGRPTRALEHALELRRKSGTPEIVNEQRFLELAGLAGAAPGESQQLFTAAQLARILGIPGPRIRGWVRRGLVRPALTRHGVDYFDFGQLSALRSVRHLTDAGVSPATLRASLVVIRRWLPDTDDALALLAHLGEEEGELVVRLDNGLVADATGQLHLPLESGGATTPVPIDDGGGRTPADWFERAVELEEQGDLEGAVRAYHRCLLVGGPDAEAAFNLGNALSALGRKEEAYARFRMAVECRTGFVEAWNNMAGVLTEMRQFQEAVEAAEEALRLAPDYPDAHFNLSLALLACGRSDEARLHGRTYLRHDPTSDWARQLRELLGLEE